MAKLSSPILEKTQKLKSSLQKYKDSDRGRKTKIIPKELGIDIDPFTSIDDLIKMQIEQTGQLNKNIALLIAEIQAERARPISAYTSGTAAITNLTERLADILNRITKVQEDYRPGGMDYYFTYPADGTKKTVGAGRTIVDFYTGKVKLPDGTEDMMSDSLEKHKLDIGGIHSVAISADQAARYSLDQGGLKPISATDFQAERNISFTQIVLETTMNTPITIWASTNPDAFFGKLGSQTTAGAVNSYGVQIDPISEYGTPAGDLGYYSGTSQVYVTLAIINVATGKYGVLKEISMTPDTHAQYKLTIAGTQIFSDIKVVNPLSLVFPANKLAAASQILLQVKSDDGTAIEVNGSIALKQVTAT